MADVFKRTELNFGGAFSADRGLLTLVGGLSPILVQNMNLSYAQQVTRLYEIGEQGAKNNVYYVGGRSQGNMTMGRVVGPRTQLSAFYDRYGDVCRAGNNHLDFGAQSECSRGDNDVAPGAIFGTTYFMLFYCVLTQIGLAVGAQDLIISENNQMMFSNLLYHGE